MAKVIILKGRTSGIQAYFEYTKKGDLPLNEYSKDFDISFIKYEEDGI